MTYDFTGRLVVITGAARGQGAEEAALLAQAGAEVIATDLVDPGEVEQDHLTYCRLDVAEPADWAALAAKLAGRTVHGLVNNAGIPMRARIGEIELPDWNHALAVNLTGPMLGMQALLPLMTEGSSIVNIGSVAGLTAHHAAAYTASKWALRGLTRTAALELAERGIRVNIVHPGLVETPIMAEAPSVFASAHMTITPLRRAGHTGEIAEAVMFLLSEHSSYITGAELPVDGGMSSHGGAMVTSEAVRRGSL